MAIKHEAELIWYIHQKTFITTQHKHKRTFKDFDHRILTFSIKNKNKFK